MPRLLPEAKPTSRGSNDWLSHEKSLAFSRSLKKNMEMKILSQLWWCFIQCCALLLKCWGDHLHITIKQLSSIVLKRLLLPMSTIRQSMLWVTPIWWKKHLIMHSGVYVVVTLEIISLRKISEASYFCWLIMFEHTLPSVGRVRCKWRLLLVKSLEGF